MSTGTRVGCDPSLTPRAFNRATGTFLSIEGDAIRLTRAQDRAA